MTASQNYADAISIAQRILSKRIAAPVSFGQPEPLISQHTVLRIPITSAADLPESIVIKQIDPNAPFDAKARALSEWVGLEFLSLIATETPLAPHFLGGDPEAMLIVLEDLGAAPTLNAVLHKSDPEAAQQTLVAYGTFLGELQRAAYGQEATFQALQARLQTRAPVSDSSIDPRTHLEQVLATLTPFTTNLEALTQEIMALSAVLHDTPEMRTLQHHDAGPHNVLVTDAGLRFVDFEFAQFNHALTDVTAVRLAFPPFSEGHMLPKTAVLAMEAAYRTAVSPVMPLLGDDAQFALLVEQACAKWLLVKTMAFGAMFESIIVNDELDNLPDPGMAKQLPAMRKLCLTWMTAYLDWYGGAARLPVLRDAIRRMLDAINKTHDVETNGLYGAFTGTDS